MNKNKGIALFTVIIFSIIMLIIVGAILVLARGHYHSTAKQIKRTKAFYLADAGIQNALFRLRTGAISPPASYIYSVTTLEGDVPVTIRITSHSGAPGGVDWDIEASVQLENVKLR
jgi:Tfp pilus assembly protein PilX